LRDATYQRPPMGTATPRAELKTRRDTQTAKERKTEKDRREAYRLVDIRDGRKCRACGSKQDLEHHHIRGRQVKDAETTGNICLLCGDCHDLRHVKRTLVITGNANQLLTFELGGKVWSA
jgi:hypothetical protein